jgi:hypothetical protein
MGARLSSDKLCFVGFGVFKLFYFIFGLRIDLYFSLKSEKALLRRKKIA